MSTLKITSWNINSVRLRAPNVAAFVEAENPDVICLQETKCRDSEFPETVDRCAVLDHTDDVGPKEPGHVAPRRVDEQAGGLAGLAEQPDRTDRPGRDSADSEMSGQDDQHQRPSSAESAPDDERGLTGPGFMPRERAARYQGR